MDFFHDFHALASAKRRIMQHVVEMILHVEPSGNQLVGSTAHPQLTLV